MDTTLKPCPLCSSTNLRSEIDGILCRGCGLWLGNGTKVDEVGGLIANWNKRQSEDEMVKMKEKLQWWEESVYGLRLRALRRMLRELLVLITELRKQQKTMKSMKGKDIEAWCEKALNVVRSTNYAPDDK